MSATITTLWLKQPTCCCTQQCRKPYSQPKENGGFSAQTYSYLYSTLIVSIIDYSCYVWGYEKHSPLDTRKCYAIFSRSWEELFHCCHLWGHRTDSWITHAFNVIKWWFRLRSYSSNRIASAVFQRSMIMAESGYKNWCWQVKQLLVKFLHFSQ